MEKLRIMTNTGAFGLPWLVAQTEGLFAQAGLDVDLVPRDPVAPEQEVFQRRKESALESRKVEVYSICEWGALQRIAQGSAGKILYVISTESPFAVLARDHALRFPRDLKDVPVGVKEYAGSHYATIAMLERYLPKKAIRTQHIGGPLLRLQRLLSGSLPAVTLMEHYIDLAQFNGAHIIVQDSFAEVAFCRGDLDDVTVRKLFTVVAETIARINQDWKRYEDLLLADVPPELRRGFKLPGLHYPTPRLYTAEEFNRIKGWMEQRGFLTTGLTFHEVVLTQGGRL